MGSGYSSMIRRDGGIDANIEELAGVGRIRQQASPRILVGHRRGDGAPEIFAQAFIAGEIKQLVAPDRPARGDAELVAREVRLAADVEIVLRIERVVAMELVGAAAQRVAARLGDDVDLPAAHAAELGAVGVGLDAELLDGFGAERRAGGAARGAVGHVVEQGAVEQVHVGARVLPVHAHAEAVRHHRPAVAMRIRRDAGLQERQVGVVAAVQRQLFDRAFVDQVTELAGARVDRRGRRRPR